MINKGKSISYFTSFKKLIISRVEMLFIFTWNAAVGSLIASRGFPEIKAIICGMTSALFLTLAVYIYNDIIDKDIDLEASYIRKKEERVIAHGIVPVNHAYALVVLSSIIGLGITYFTNNMTFKIGLSYWIFLMLYSFPRVRFKTMFLMKTVVKAFGGPFFPLLIGGSAINNAVSPLVLFIALVSGTYAFLVIPIVTDYADLEEKRIHVFGNNILSVILIVVWSLLVLSKARKLPVTYDLVAVRSIQKIIYAFFMFFDFLIFIGTLNLSVIIPFF
jgi:4-hydroxybenzoate polyprenyltransferase